MSINNNQKNNIPAIQMESGPILLRNITENDKEQYLSLRKEASDYSVVFSNSQDFCETMWESLLEATDDIPLMVYRKDNTFIGMGTIQHIYNDEIEIGYDVLISYRGQGYGTMIAKALIGIVKETFPDASIVIRTKTENKASQRVIEKCGGILDRKEDTPESVLIQTTLEFMKPEELTEQKYCEYQKFIENGRNRILVYRIPKDVI